MNNIELIEQTYVKAVEGIKEDWFSSSNTNWYDYIVNLPVTLKATNLIVILHNQVFDGGFHQYFVNGYGQFASETIEALVESGFKKKIGSFGRSLQSG